MKTNNHILLAILAVVTLLTGLGLNQFAQASPPIDTDNSTSTSQWTIEALTPDFEAVDMVTSTDGWAAADFLLYHYDGSRWQLAQEVDSKARIEDLDMLSVTDGWAVGSTASVDNASAELGAIWHFDGNQWQTFPSPTDRTLYSVEMLSPTDGWAVGANVILRYNGVAWEVVSTDFSGDDIDVISDNDVWAVGWNGIYHYDGSTWQQASDNRNMDAISMVSATEGWAVGYDWQSRSSQIMRYDGTTWSEVASPTTNNLNDVVMLSSTNGWAAGRDGTILQYNGTSWQSVDSPTASYLNAISIVSATTAWIVGDDSTILQYDGSTWQTRIDLLTPAASVSERLQAVDMLSATDGWAVGGGGVILNYDGDKWNSVASPTDKTLYDIDMLSATSGWAVAGGYSSDEADQVIFYYDGSSWQSHTNLPDISLYAVDMVSTTSGWAVGYNSAFAKRGSAILHYDGNSWNNIANSTEQALYDVDMISASSGWAVGGNGVILSYDGSSWNNVASPTEQDLHAIDMVSATEGWAVGGESYRDRTSVILYYDGNSWQSVTSPTDQELHDVAMVSATEGWAVGIYGTLLYYDGNNWQSVTRPTGRDLKAITMLDSQTGRIVGESGVILSLSQAAAACYPNLPSPQLALKNIEPNDSFTRYNLTVDNRSSFPDELFAPAPHLPPCGANTNASRTWVDIYDGDDNYIYGFCGLSSANQLDDIWFAVSEGESPPSSVYITLQDRECDNTYTSNSISPSGQSTYAISGRVTDRSGTGISGVTVSDGAGHSATTDSNGNYTISALANGDYTLTPSKSGYTFEPTSRSVSVQDADVTGQDFVGTGMSENVELIGHIGGTSYATFVQGNYAYIGIGPKLTVLDVTDLSNPVWMGDVILPTVIRDIYVAGSYGYVVTGGHLQIVDLSNPAAPTVVAFYSTPVGVGAVTTRDNYAYVADHDGLYILDISNPTNPTEVGSYEAPSTAWWTAEDITLAGDYAYVATEVTGIQVIDISDPTAPVKVSTFSAYPNGGYALGVAIKGTYAYISSDGAGLQVEDVSDPTEPTEVGFIRLNWSKKVAVVDNHAYVTTSGNGLQIVDVSEPATPIVVGSYNTPGSAQGLAIASDYVYIADWDKGLRVVDASDPTAPVEIGAYDTSMYAEGVAVADDYAYVADTTGLQVIDISNLASPVEAGFYDTPGEALRVKIDGDYTYVADKDEGLRIINVSNPAAPTEVGFYKGGGHVRDVVVAGELAYLASGTYVGVIDVSDPTNPVEIGSYQQTAGYVESIAVESDYAYFTASSEGLRILDIADPTAPVEVSSYDPSGSAEDVTLAGNYAYLANGSGMHIINVSDPAAPTQIGFYSTPSSASGVAVADDYAYVADWSQGLRLIDVSNPAIPTQSGFYDTPGNAEEVVVVDGYAFVADRDGGLFILRYNPSSSTEQYSISGRVTDSSGAGISGVTVSAGAGHSATTDSNGDYTISALANGDYTLTPSKSGYTFSPTSRSVSVQDADVTGQDFVGMLLTPTPTPTPTPTNSPTPVPAVASFPFYDGFEASRASINRSNRVPDALGAGWSGFFTSQGEIAVSNHAAYGGNLGVLLHDSVRDENASTSALILTIDLAGQQNVELDFWWREFNDENHPTDGVFISDNWGGTWHQVLSFNNGSNEFRQERIHLDPYVTANGLSFNDHFQIKFQFYDNHPYPNDGYAIDDVSVQPYVPGDPTAPTPVITDAYENDDSCEDAGTLTTDGRMQEHTFHDEGDEDWLKIEATEGITIVIEARVPPASNADVLLELYSDCGDHDPDGGQDPSFSEDVRLTLRPPATGTYYMRLLNHDPTVFGNDLGYTLSVREVPTGAAPGALIVVAGRLRENDRVQPNIHHVTNAVYQFAREHGCAPSDIYYLAPDMSLDGDGDGLPDVDAQVSKAQLQQAITEWAPDHVGANEPLTIYLMDHGGEERFYLDGTSDEWVTPAELDSWLSELESTIPGLETNVIYEACQSGSFISQPQSISGPRRLVMTSTGQWSLAYASQEGAIFSDTFIDALAQGMNLQAAFSEGALAANSVHPDQSAWLDDNGDGVYTSTDGEIAAQRAFACTAPPTEQLWAPYIEQASVAEVSQNQAQISAHVLDDKNEITEVRAVIYAPSYTQPDSSEEIIAEVPPVILEPQGSGQYSVTSEQFTEAGTYRVLIYADDADGLTSRPQEIMVEVSPQHDLYLPILTR